MGVFMDYIFIDSKEEKNIVGIVEDSRLVEYYFQDIDSKFILGNIYRAKVKDTLKGMEAAFVDIGREKNAFLHLKDALSREQILSKKNYKLKDIIKSGEDIIVQVIKEEVGTKGAKITTHISIPGRNLILTPYVNKVNISKKIKEKSEIKRLKEIMKNIIKDHMGVIIRTASHGVDKSILEEEYNRLVDIYMDIERQRNFLPVPKLLYSDLDLVYKILREAYKPNMKIIVNDKKTFENINLYFDYIKSENMVYDSEFSVEYNSTIQKEIKGAIKRSVELKSGGYIVIDETEALTVIDVNTGKNTGVSSLEDTVLNTNLEAAAEIARQIRLRDIGGIIIIDFIDMNDNKHLEMVIKKLEEEFSKDRNRPNIVDVTKLTLVEITRKRKRNTLDNLATKICPTCNGKGRIRNKI